MISEFFITMAEIFATVLGQQKAFERERIGKKLNA